MAVGQNQKLGIIFPIFPSFRFAIFSFFKKKFFDILNYRNSRSQMFFKVGVLKNFAIFIGKRLCWSLFFYQSCRPEASNFLKKETPAHLLSCEYWEVFKNSFLIEQLWWLLLKVGNSFDICFVLFSKSFKVFFFSFSRNI